MLEELGTIQEKINDLESQKQSVEMEYYQLGSDISRLQREIDVLTKRMGNIQRKF